MTENMTPNSTKPIDMHVHVVGNGSSGSGCWMRLTGWHKAMAMFMVRHIGLPISSLKGDFDRIYLEKLLEQVRGSSIGAAVILAQDEVYSVEGKKLDFGSFHVPNEYVCKLAREHKEFLPACSIHPARPDALEELDRCLANGAVMMKILPNCQNIDCNNPRYKKFWERMAEAKLPLLAHTGGEHTLPVFEKKYSDPRILKLPLECGVNVIAAHSGTKSGLTDPEYFFVFAEMTQRYPNLYGDNSAMNVPMRGKHIPECLREPLASRIVFGSDFPVPVSGRWAYWRGFLDKESFRKWDAQPNVIERDYQLKKATGFSDESFTRIWQLLRRPEKQHLAG